MNWMGSWSWLDAFGAAALLFLSGNKSLNLKWIVKKSGWYGDELKYCRYLKWILKKSGWSGDELNRQLEPVRCIWLLLLSGKKPKEIRHKFKKTFEEILKKSRKYAKEIQNKSRRNLKEIWKKSCLKEGWRAVKGRQWVHLEVCTSVALQF